VLTASDAAQRILSFADGLPGPYGYERSIKFIGQQVYRDRFLVSFPKLALTLGANLDGLLEQLDFPAAGVPRLQGFLAEGDILHLGFEGEATAYVCKLYVENAAHIRQLWASASNEPDGAVRVHRALKWWPENSSESSLLETQYDWLPCADRQALLHSIANLWPTVPRKALSDLLAVACRKVPAKDLQLLKVSEPDSIRNSFDLNLYDACLSLSDVQSILEAMLVDVGAERSNINAILLPLADEALGHVAGGVARNGKLFLSLYFGVVERGRFNA